jgi:hypothetical protein
MSIGVMEDYKLSDLRAPLFDFFVFLPFLSLVAQGTQWHAAIERLCLSSTGITHDSSVRAFNFRPPCPPYTPTNALASEASILFITLHNQGLATLASLATGMVTGIAHMHAVMHVLHVLHVFVQMLSLCLSSVSITDRSNHFLFGIKFCWVYVLPQGVAVSGITKVY